MAITEVGPRDGLQNEKIIVPTADKLEFIKLLMDANINNIEATSFVSPKYIPQFSDANDIYPELPQKEGVRFFVLVPNMRGLQGALNAGAKNIVLFVAASETFNKNNINRITSEALIESEKVVKEAKKNGIFVRGCVVTAFYCPYEGKINTAAANNITKHYMDFGCDEIGFGDTVGRATPLDVGMLLEETLEFLPAKNIYMHFHDTYGCGLANVLKSLEYGISLFDASTGALGGCPYAPGATGNTATEDMLYMLHGMGIETGISLEGVLKARQFIEIVLNRSLPSHVGMAHKISR